MNIKLALGRAFTKLGLLKLCIKIVKKLGYIVKFYDHHANGIDLAIDIKQDTKPEDILVVFDVGASIGSMSYEFLNYFPNGIIHAFEPNKTSFNQLAKRFENNKRVVCNQTGLSESGGEFKMYLQADSGYNSLNEAVNLPSSEMNSEFQMVKVTTINEYCESKGIQKIDFLKIDTEGLDLAVLKGASNLLNKRMIRYIFVEATFHKDNVQNTQFTDLSEFLQDYGFKVRAIYDQSNFGEKKYLTCVNAMFLLQ